MVKYREWVQNAVVILCSLFSFCRTVEHDSDYDENSGDDAWLTDYTGPGYLPSCDNILLLQTIDGRLHAVNRDNGQSMWGDSIQLSKDWFPQYNDPVDDMDLNFMPDPTDGSLYYFDHKTSHLNDHVLKKMGLTIPQMIESSPTRSEDGLLYTGDKKDRWQIVDPNSGEVLQKVDQKGTNGKKIDTTPFMKEKLYIGYTEYYLTIFDTSTESVKWNLTYSEVSAKEMHDTYDGGLNIDVCSNCGIIAVSDEKGQEKWRSNFGFPIIGVYSSWQSGLLKNPFKMYGADHFSQHPHIKQDLVQTAYVGQYKQQLYVLPSMGKLQQIGQSTELIVSSVGHYPMPLEAKPRTPELPGPSDTVIIPEPTCPGGDHDSKKCRADGTRPGKRDAATQATVEASYFANLKISSGVIGYMVGKLSDVMVLQSIVLILILILTISFSWNNILNQGVKKVGRIEFTTDEFLGKGCLGTSVFRGTFDGRNVAVKRLLSDCFTLANREIELLRQAEHPNLLRYYCSEIDKQFIYIALELCEGDLDFYIQNRSKFENLEPVQILHQCASGIDQLHSLGVIHRDIKPSNILITYNNKKSERRAVIADFGLCRQVVPGRSSISVTGLHGTEGWAAPEVFTRDVKSVTYAVDVFSLGCVFYFILSSGSHPYGSEFFMRQAHIRQGKHNLENLEPLEEELIVRMIRPLAADRIRIEGVLAAPIFWNAEKSLRFLSDASDKLEREQNDSQILYQLEKRREEVGGLDWRLRLQTGLQEDLRKFRTYSEDLKDLLRAIRNKRHHQRDLTEEARIELGTTTDSFFAHWNRRFPMLMPVTYQAICCAYARDNDDHFAEFFDAKSAHIAAGHIEKMFELLKEAEKNGETEEADNKGFIDTKDIPFSHKVKTKMIWADKPSPKHRRYNPLPYFSTEASKCTLLCGGEIEIPADIPLRRGKDIVSLDDLHHSFPVFLMMIESIREEVEAARETRRIAKEEEERKAREKQEEEAIKKIVEIKPGFVEGLPVTLPGGFGTALFSRGFNFVRQLSQSGAEPENDVLVNEMIGGLLDDYDEDEIPSGDEITSGSDFEYEFGAIGTPKHKRKLRKRQVSASETGNAEIAPLLEPGQDDDQKSVENQDQSENKTKPKNRRKRTKKNGKTEKNQKKNMEKKVS